jgi:hypothetical protein
VYYQGLQQALKQKGNQQQAIQKLKQQFAQSMQDKMRAMMPVPEQQPVDMKALGEAVKAESEDKKQDRIDARQQDKEDFDAWKLETTQKFNEWKTNTTQQFQQHLQTMRDDSREALESKREMAMLQALGIRLSAKDKEALEVKPSDINKEINENLKDMRQQFAQAEGQLKSLRTQLANHPFYSRLGGTSTDDVDAAQATADNLKKSIAYIEANRSAVVSGKMDMSKVLDQAQQIATGSPDLSVLGGTKAGDGDSSPKGAP